MTDAPKTPQELRQLAVDIVGGRVFTSNHIPESVPPETIMQIFIPFGIAIAQGGEAARTLMEGDIGMIYEYLSAAGSRGVNGYPSFLSFRMLTHAETEQVCQHVVELQAFVEGGESENAGRGVPTG